MPHVITVIDVREPRSFEWFRTRPDPPPPIVIRALFARRQFWLAEGAAATNLTDPEAPRSKLVLAINHVGDAFLCPLAHAPNPAARSLAQAADTADTAWTRIRWRQDTGTFDVLTSPCDFGPSHWPHAALAEIALVAFDGRTITDPDHPLIREMRCGLPPTEFIPNPAA
jgi:hypothetical protein